MTTKTRLFTETDRMALQKIYLESRKFSYNWMDKTEFKLEDFDRDTEGELIWVATHGTMLTGFISVWKAENFIHNLFIYPEAIRKGVGSALLNVCLNEIGRPATLKCLVKNTNAKDFYLFNGWKIVENADGPDGQYYLMQFNKDS